MIPIYPFDTCRADPTCVPTRSGSADPHMSFESCLDFSLAASTAATASDMQLLQSQLCQLAGWKLHASHKQNLGVSRSSTALLVQ